MAVLGGRQGSRAHLLLMRTAALLLAALLFQGFGAGGWGAVALAQEGATGEGAAPQGTAQDQPAVTVDLQPFDVDARAAVLLDVHTGTVLYAKNADERMAPASLAKIVTMLLALEAIDAGRVSLTDRAVVSEAAWELAGRGRPGGVSAMFLEVGESVTIEDLLYGVGVVSGNDAALVLAEHLAGSEQAFVRRMNERAAELGLRNTHFVDSHGLSPDAYTTAADMARLAAFFVRTQHDGLVYAHRPEFEYNGITQVNRNGLVMRDPRVTGLKTGYLGVAGYHLVATAETGEMSLAAAVMGAASDADRERIALELLNYGFTSFRTVVPADDLARARLRVYKGAANEVAVQPAARPAVTVPAEAVDQLEWRLDLPSHLEAPVDEGERVGTLTATLGDHEVASFDIVAAARVERGGLFKVILDSIRLFLAGLFGRL